MSTENKDQLKRFKETAKELECDESEKAMDKAFKSLKPQTEKKKGKKQ